MTQAPLKLYQAYELDTGAVNEGRWITYRNGIQVKTRSTLSRAYREKQQQQTRAHMATLTASDFQLPMELADQLEVESVATLVTDWKGATDKDGNVIEPTPANVKMVLTDLEVFRRDILQEAAKEAQYRRYQVEAAGKFSATPSAPDSSSRAELESSRSSS